MNKSISKSTSLIFNNSKKVKNVQNAASNFHTTSKRDQKVLTVHNMNENVKKMQYAVRGPIVLRAGVIENEILNGDSKPFDRVIRANIGDCHATGQKPITYLRSIMALAAYPDLLNSSEFPDDVKEKVRRFLSDCKGNSVGSYTESEGIKIVRQDVAKYIEQRDKGVKANWDDIYLTTGASDGIKSIMEILQTNTNQKPAGFMIPIPQYPFYSATISEFNSHPIGYYLDEDKDWALDVNELQIAYDKAKEDCIPRALVVINPGNPTGQVLSKDNIKNIIKWAYDNKLFIMADEVYQDNVYAEGSKFHSFKKVAASMEAPYNQVEISSFYSTSKGYMGECGIRGGFMEVFNMDPKVKAHLDKLSSVRLCSSSLGQACMYGIVNPPKPGEPSYDLFIKEKNQVLNGLKEKATLVSRLLNSIEGVKCNPVQGAMYAFPQITIPQKAIEKAQSLEINPDVFYCFQLLEQTGICVVPGSGFHQRPGTYHFRTTILPPVDQIRSLLAKFERFHVNFTKQWKR